MKKRILAWIGICLLLAMYIADIVFALIGSEFAQTMLRVSVGCSVAVPIILYAFYIAMGGRKKRYEEMAARLTEDEGAGDEPAAENTEDDQ